MTSGTTYRMKTIIWLLPLAGARCASRRLRLVPRGGAVPPALLLRGGDESPAHGFKAKADALQRKDKFKDAAAMYEKALASVDDDLLAATIRLNLARCHLKLEDDDKAIEVCDAVVVKVGPRSPLRATALYRRACAKQRLNKLSEAYVDAKTAQSLGHAQAFNIVDTCKDHAPPEPAAPLLPFRALQSGGGPKQMLEGLLEDPAKARALVPLAKSLGSAATLKNVLNLPVERAEQLARVLADFDEDKAEKWARRAKRCVGCYKNVRKFSKFWRRNFPRAAYGGCLYLFGTDSLRLLRQKA